MMKEIQQLPPEIVAKKGEVYHHFLASDFKLLESDRLVYEWATRQTYIAMGNMMTAAAQVGIDSCAIEGFDQERAEAILEQEGILDRSQYGLACMLAFGYRVKEPRSKTRRPMDEVTVWVH